ncbi:single-stranded DNA-binding protein [Serinibacter salmoneus]|nr:single-stranded DNA-binding protein [Serinibacter salmoneus]
MSNETTLTVRGIAGTTPQLARTNDHGAWTRFRLACTRSRRGEDGSWEDAETLWFTVRAYRHLAARVAQSVRAGYPLLVRGRLVDDSYVDRDGVAHHGTAIHAEAVAIDIAAYGVVTFDRGTRADGAPGDATPSGATHAQRPTTDGWGGMSQGITTGPSEPAPDHTVDVTALEERPGDALVGDDPEGPREDEAREDGPLGLAPAGTPAQGEDPGGVAAAGVPSTA